MMPSSGKGCFAGDRPISNEVSIHGIHAKTQEHAAPDTNRPDKFYIPNKNLSSSYTHFNLPFQVHALNGRTPYRSTKLAFTSSVETWAPGGIPKKTRVDAPLLRGHMPELDVFRGTAVTLVVLYHFVYWTATSQPGHLANLITQLTLFGWLGVNLFFVLSGFLITGVLLDVRERPGFFRRFYARRARRIIPAYALCIVLLLAFGMVSIGGVLRALTFTSNYGWIPAQSAYGPLWSLSVEEQFYVFWPLVVFCTTRRALTGICIGICILEPALRYLAVLHGSHVGAVHEAAYLIADNLALGALGALFFRSRFGIRKYALLFAGALAALAIFLLAVGIPEGLLHRANPFGAAFQVEPFELLFAAGIFASITWRSGFFSGRLTRPLRFLGEISYGLYLFHLIVSTVYDRLFPVRAYYGHFGIELLRALVCITVALNFSWVSRWYYEEHFLRKRS
jgi:peptidoglycan/LPS O-acetylase OafA/YrhL